MPGYACVAHHHLSLRPLIAGNSRQTAAHESAVDRPSTPGARGAHLEGQLAQDDVGLHLARPLARPALIVDLRHADAVTK